MERATMRSIIILEIVWDLEQIIIAHVRCPE